jgi:Na+-transporting NADH:ubiquinone oxidoreductase subunit C
LAESPATPNGSGADAGPLRTLGVAFAVCVVCSAVVTGAVVGLRPYQAENQRLEREGKIRDLVEGLPGVAELVESVGEARLEVRMVALASGEYAPAVDPAPYLEGPPPEGEPLPPKEDPAGVGSVPELMPVYELRREGALHTVLLPVHGQGYLSTLRGFLAVAGDGNTVRGITFTEQEETPGLGAEIQSEAWQALWRGKKLRGEAGDVRIRVVQEPPAGADLTHRVQGISGATVTSQSVSELVRFWVGPRGFGPYLARIADEGGTT